MKIRRSRTLRRRVPGDFEATTAADAARHPFRLAAVSGAFLALLLLRATPSGAGCCEFPGGCLNVEEPPACDGVFHPPPSLCDLTLAPPACTEEPPPWPGFEDGRLNPDPDEYYAVWCAFDRAEVYRLVPATALLKQVPMLDLIELSVGGALDLGDFMTAVRTGLDTVTIFGSNGNGAPGPGSKSFGLAECIEANGGAPEPATDDPPPSGPEGAEDIGPSPSEVCFALYGPAGDVGLLVDCLEFVAERDGGTSLDICWLPVFRFRIGSPGFFAPVAASVPSEEIAGSVPSVAADGGGFLFLGLYLQLTRLRDEVFPQTPGGRRATQLYFEHNSELLAAALRNSAVLTTGRDALEAWAPIVDAIVAENTARAGVAGGGSAAGAGGTTVSAAQVQAFEDFLNAVRSGASPALLLALEHAVERVDPASFLGLSPAEVLARLDRLGCDASAEFGSILCRLQELAGFIDANVERRLRKRFANPVARSIKWVSGAEAAGDNSRRRRVLLRRALRLLGRVERRLEFWKVVQRVPEAARGFIDAEAAALRADVAELVP